MKKIMVLLGLLTLIGCEPTLDKESSFEEVISVLSENFERNQTNFSKIVNFYKENGSLSLEEELLCPYQETDTKERLLENIDNKEYLKIKPICDLHAVTKTYNTIIWDNKVILSSYQNRTDGYINVFSYYYTPQVGSDMKECPDYGVKQREEKGSCLIPLTDKWFIEYRYLPVPKSNP
ncbi:hypothetical protein [Kangiella sediminilitoris]|uniref:hypothetical protein n=1 Tax=Kangiella sediminilitoris TaxID=1144748 RepID=UPI0012E9CE22|nr:hypothetical protein [Kangiella sediminilitoris]